MSDRVENYLIFGMLLGVLALISAYGSPDPMLSIDDRPTIVRAIAK